MIWLPKVVFGVYHTTSDCLYSTWATYT